MHIFPSAEQVSVNNLISPSCHQYVAAAPTYGKKNWTWKSHLNELVMLTSLICNWSALYSSNCTKCCMTIDGSCLIFLVHAWGNHRLGYCVNTKKVVCFIHILCHTIKWSFDYTAKGTIEWLNENVFLTSLPSMFWCQIVYIQKFFTNLSDQIACHYNRKVKVNYSCFNPFCSP